MKILQTVIVKQILTEKSKQELSDQWTSKRFQLQKECDQLRFEQKKMEKSKNLQPLQLQTYEHEIGSRMDKIRNIDFRIEQLHMLPLGSELKLQEVQAVIDLNIGDQWSELGKTIIIKDGKVVDIK
ncbi:YlqD family protein [Bacillus sp. AK128]